MWGRYEKDRASMGSEVLAKFAACGADTNYILTGVRREPLELSFEARLERLRLASEYAAKMGTSEEEQLRLQEQFLATGESVPIRRVSFFDTEPYQETYTGLDPEKPDPVYVPRNWLEFLGRPERMALFRYERDDMAPDIMPGDMVMFEEGEPLRLGCPYVVNINGVVRIQMYSEGYERSVFSSLNPTYLPHALAEDADDVPWLVLGRVVWWSREAYRLLERLKK
jgi:phage repressor protein C with HTH and peptisase S24 domain